MDFSERYRIIQSRDARFDGQFITAVRTTGIYCRPQLPARTPKEANVTFYETSAAAHEAGYRACRRCLPEAVPGTPAWNLRDDLAGRAMRLIADGIVEREGVGGLSRRLGYSERHLSRVLGEQLGAGPLALARAHRAQAARTLLTSTDLSMADVAFAAGFTSIRQFNDTVSEVFELTPSQLRARHRGAEARAGGSIRLSLPAREPFDAAGVFAWLAVRAVPGVEIATADSYTRSLQLPGGPAWFTVTPGAGGVVLEAHLTTLADLSTLVSRVRRLFDLDADPIAVDAALSAAGGGATGGPSGPSGTSGSPSSSADPADPADVALAAAVAANPGIRLPGTVDPVEMLVRAMVGQQISVAAARTHLGRLAAVAGRPLGLEGGPELLFPDAAAIAEHADAVTGPRARVASLRGAAEAMASGSLELSSGDSAADQRAALLALPGIGPWTADYVAMRVLGAPDLILTGDVALRTGAAALGAPSAPRDLARWAERYAPGAPTPPPPLARRRLGTDSRAPVPAASVPASPPPAAPESDAGAPLPAAPAPTRAPVPARPPPDRPRRRRRGNRIRSRPTPGPRVPSRRSRHDPPQPVRVDPDGAFGILADEDGRVVASGWTDETEALLARLAPAHRDDVTPRVLAAAGAVDAFSGDVAAIDAVEVEQHGGDFHLHAWQGLRTIEPGHPLTYAQFAASLGRPSAVRAAASACARNAPALFVPCHRVLRTDGTLGGFAWGVDVKRSLLAREAEAGAALAL